MALPRMRTINEAYEFLLSLDKETSITKNFIREMCKHGKVHCIYIGKKCLLDIDNLIENLSLPCEI